MGLTRTSSGLVVRDEFGGDTSGNYNLVGSITISDGVMNFPTGLGIAIHKTGNPLCVTGKTVTTSAAASTSIVLSDNDTWANAADRDGYFARYNSNVWQLYKSADGSASSLGTYSQELSFGITILNRLYRSGTSLIYRFGTTALSGNISVTESTYTTTMYGGGRQNELSTSTLDDLDLRTSHLITCSGMTTGHYLRVSDGTTEAEAQESSGTASVDAGAVLFPLASVQIRTASGGGGDLIAELDTGDYADMGGGDAFAYSGASAVWLPFMKHNVIGLGGLYG